jgi:mannose-6-phosphate isomerase
MNKEIKNIKPYFDYKIWGGSKISKLFGLNTKDKIGEAWLISTHIKGSSILSNGKLLREEIDLPYLIKIIDTTDNLSVQVHPDDQYAQKFENDLGKSECWYILEAEKNAGIYLGFKDGVTKDSFKEVVNQNKNVNEYLNFFPVQAGDFFYVPAGTVHAIGAGITLIEIQKSSGVTYRVWDWNRLENGKPRELHINKAFEVFDFNSRPNVIKNVKSFQFEGIHFEIFDTNNDQLEIEINNSISKINISKKLFQVSFLG